MTKEPGFLRGEDGNPNYYRRLSRNIALVMVGVSLIPLVLIGGVLLRHFGDSYHQKVHAYLDELIQKHSQNIDGFLTARLADIRVMARSNNPDRLRDGDFLGSKLNLLREEYGGVYVDLGLIDSEGIQVAYAGPFILAMANYAEADWFKKYHVSKSGDKIICPRGLLILSKKPIVSPDYGLLPSKQRRAYLIVETKVNGVNFKVATCHLDSFLKEGAARAKQLDIFFKKLSPHDNAIFLGDFNFGDNAQPETKHLDNSYVDVWTRVNGDKKGYTWNIEKSKMARDGSFPNEKSRRLDRVLIKSKRVKPVSAKIVGDKPVEGKTDIFPSDHFGLRATVSVSGN